MKSTFRLYGRLRSSYFDLVSGEREPQQTKGLGLLLSKSPNALKAFLKIEDIKSRLNKVTINENTEVIVHCEPFEKNDSGSSDRIDIIIEVYQDKKPDFLLIIEAKSASKNVSPESVKNQLIRYLSNQRLVDKDKFKERVFGVILTKLTHINNQDPSVILITWSNVINSLLNESKYDHLVNDYVDFITNIRGTMKFYDKDILSIPTSESSQVILKDHFLYVCPNSGIYITKYKPLFLAFRKPGGGEMDSLYKVDNIVIVNFSSELKAFTDDEEYRSNGYADRVINYYTYMFNKKHWNEVPKEEMQVFFLDKNVVIDLPKKPRPNRNNSFRCYYDLGDILQNELVIPSRDS